MDPISDQPGRQLPRAASAIPVRTLTLAVALTLALAGCTRASAEGPSGPTSAAATPSAGGSPSAPGTGGGAPAQPVLAGDVATGLSVPWGVAFLGDGSALVAQRTTGDVVRVRPGAAPVTVGRVPGVADLGEGGLLGLALAPDDKATLYAYLTTQDDNRIVAMPLNLAPREPGRGLGTPRVLLSGLPNSGRHNGGRIVIGPDGKLWVGGGDAGDTALSQRKDSLGGKILRINLDGSVPTDNPFPGSAVWSLGHRNVQGLAFDSAGRLWATEFGQNTWDELNLIEKGLNYGWPEVEGRESKPGFVDPQVAWKTSEASPSGLAIVDDVAYVAALRGQKVWVVPLVDGKAGTPVAALDGVLGRIRTIEQAPDGALWLTTSNTDGRGQPKDGDDRVVRATLTGS